MEDFEKYLYIKNKQNNGEGMIIRIRGKLDEA